MEETTTLEKEVSLALDSIINEAKRIEENSLYSAKSHFVAAQDWEKIHLRMGVPTVILAGIAGTLAFARVPWLSTISGVLAVIVAILTGIITFLNPKERATSHHTAGNNYDSLLSRVRIFRTVDCRRENSDALITDELKKFSEERDRLNRDCPQPPRRAFEKAKKGIEAGEASYEVDEEPA